VAAAEEPAPPDANSRDSDFWRIVDMDDEPARAGAAEAFCQAHPERAESLRAALALAQPTALADASTPAKERLTRLEPYSQRLREQRAQGAPFERGGMGDLLRVRDAQIGRTLAMKVLRKDLPPDKRTATLERFLEEAQIQGQLDHPGIVPVHELGVDAEGTPCFTMRLVRGETAAAIFAKARRGADGWSITRALGIVERICETMAYAHGKGVIHRDLKPANVMVGRFGEVYVMDWGLAKVLGRADTRDLRVAPASSSPRSQVATDRSKEAESDPDSPLVTMDGAVIGTPSYMPPEQAEGRVEVLGVRGDVYAVGAMLYELLTGQAPYAKSGARVSPHTLLALVIAGPPRPVHELDRTIPAELVAICARAMAREPEARYADMRELAADVRAYLERRVVRAYRTGPVAELAMWVRRNRALAAALAAAVVAMVGGIVAWSFFKEKQRAQESQARAEENAALAEKERDNARMSQQEAEKEKQLAQENERRARKAEKDLVEGRRKEDEALRQAHAERTRADTMQEQSARHEKHALELAAQLGTGEIGKVLRLLVSVLAHRDLASSQEDLWPPVADQLRPWLTSAEQILKSVPDLEEAARNLAARARPMSAAQAQRQRQAHPRAAELANLERKVDALRRAQAVREGRAAVNIPQLSDADLSLTAAELNERAWAGVARWSSERKRWGDEPTCVAMVQAALAKVDRGEAFERVYLLDTLMWAWFAVGRDDEARVGGGRTGDRCGARGRAARAEDLVRGAAARHQVRGWRAGGGGG